MAARYHVRCVAGLLLAIVLSVLSGCSAAMVPDPRVRFVAFGDSTTAGPTDRQYWQIVQERLGESPEAFAGQGQGGESAAEGVLRLQELLANQIYPNAEVFLYWEGGDAILEFVKEHDPLLLTSPNAPDYPFADDLTRRLDEVQGNIEEAIRLAQEAGWTVYVATYYDMRENIPCRPALLDVLLPAQAANANVYVDRLNERIRQAAVNRNAVLVDVATIADSLRSDPGNYVNCNHLSEQGNGLVADLFVSALGHP